MTARAIRDITDFVFISDEPRKADVILIPGTSQSGVTVRAAELYRQGFAPYVLPAGRWSASRDAFARDKIDDSRYDGDFETDFAYCANILRLSGVPESAILREDRSAHTMENAAFSAAVLKEAGIKVRRAIICCQAFHARRALLTYACHFPGVELLMAPVETQGIRREDWYRNEASWQRVMSEVNKCGKYFTDYREILTGINGV